MFGMLDYRAHKLYLLLFGVPNIILLIFCLVGLPLINYTLGFGFADQRFMQILTSIGVSFVTAIVWWIFFEGFLNKLAMFIFGLLVDVIPSDGRNKEQAKLVVFGGEKAIIQIKMKQILNPREWTDEDIASFAKSDWVSSWLLRDKNQKQCEAIRERFKEDPHLTNNDANLSAILKENGLETTLFEEVFGHELARKYVVSLVFFSYFVLANPFGL